METRVRPFLHIFLVCFSEQALATAHQCLNYLRFSFIYEIPNKSCFGRSIHVPASFEGCSLSNRWIYVHVPFNAPSPHFQSSNATMLQWPP